MALQPASTPIGVGPPDIPGDVPRHGRHKTPWIRKPGLEWEPADDDVKTRRRGRGSYYTRASNLGSPIEDKYKVSRARERRIVFGMSRHPELVRAAQAVISLDDERDELERLADKANEYGRGDAAAMHGTAFHRLREQHDAGVDLSHLDTLTAQGLATWNRLLSPFKVVGSEQFVVCDEIETAGTYDALLELTRPWVIRNKAGHILGTLATGDRITADLKSGRWGPAWFGAQYAVQAWPYANGVPYSHRGGRMPWPDDRPPRTDWAVIPYVSLDNLDEAGLYWINLAAAKLRVDGVKLIKQLRATDDLFFADTPQHPIALTELALLALIRDVVDEAELGRLYEAHQHMWTPACRAKARARAAEWEETAG
jgi:hypothetical protein